MPAARDPLHHVNTLSFIAEEIHRDLWKCLSPRLDAVSISGNQQIANDAAKLLIKRTVAALIDLAELGSSVDLPKDAEAGMSDALSDSWDDATARAWERTREAAEEEARGVAA